MHIYLDWAILSGNYDANAGSTLSLIAQRKKQLLTYIVEALRVFAFWANFRSEEELSETLYGFLFSIGELK